jgi:hypothetical protein
MYTVDLVQSFGLQWFSYRGFDNQSRCCEIKIYRFFVNNSALEGWCGTTALNVCPTRSFQLFLK